MKTRKLLKGREITNGYVVIVFSFASDCLGGWREFSELIAKISLVKPKQAQTTFDKRLQIAPME